MKKYRFLGKESVEIYGLGIVQPDQIVETGKEINNPLFKLVENSKEDKPKKINNSSV